LIRSFCPVGGVVLDCTLGTGTTALAAIMEKRQFVGCDCDPAMIARALGRIDELMRGEEVA
jgi:DNA modification methylase